MKDNKFRGLAEAKMKSLQETSEESVDDQAKESEDEKEPVKPTRKAASKKAGKLASNKASDKVVGVTIRIPEEKRVWWNVQAKLQRITLTEAIIEALDKRFGPPRKF